MSTKVKIYKNAERDKPETYKPYVPQYQVMGVEPMEYKSPLIVGNNIPKPSPGSTDNPREPRPHMRQQAYAEAVPSPIGRGKGPIPNVGNNMEQTWSGVDGEIVDDISNSLDHNHKMIDNNEFVNANTLGLTDNEYLEEKILPRNNEAATNSFLSENALQKALKEDKLSNIFKELEEDEYCILVAGTPICSGPSDYVQEQTRALVFGEHELYSGNPISTDDIVVIKRVSIKVGVFLY